MDRHVVDARKLVLFMSLLLTGCAGRQQRPIAPILLESAQVEPHVILREALAEARYSNDLPYRLSSLLTIVRVLEKLDPQEAGETLEEVASLVPKLPEKASFWERLQLGSGEAWSFSQYVAQIQTRIELKTEVSLELVNQFAPRDASRTLQIALSIKLPYARALAVETSLRAWPAAEKDSVISIAERLADSENSAVNFAALASGVAVHDTLLAATLAGRAVNALRPKDALTAALVIPILIRVKPLLAWQALKALDKEDEDVLVTRAAMLRQLVQVMPEDMHLEMRDFALDILESIPTPRPLFYSTSGALRKQLRLAGITADAVVSLGAVDPVLAQHRAGESDFYRRVTSMFLERGGPGWIRKDKETREQLERTFYQNLAQLDLALSLLESDPRGSLIILESFDNAFWDIFVYVTLRGEVPSLDGPTARRTEQRLIRLLIEVKTRWPAVAIAQHDSTNPERSLERVIEISARLDSIAALVVAKKKKSRWVWADYLPFALASVAGAVHQQDSQAAEVLFERAVNIAATIAQSPAREWSLVWNAAAWNKYGSAKARVAGARAVSLVVALEKHKPWTGLLSRLVYQVARLDPRAALQIALSKEAASRRAYVLTAVAAAMVDEGNVKRQTH